STSHAPGSSFALGTTTVTCTATDIHGNTVSASFDVTVTDDEAPSITSLPGVLTFPAEPGLCSGLGTWSMPTASDNCGVANLTSTHMSGDSFPVGSTEVTYTAIDHSGNTATAMLTIVIVDIEPPSITAVPADITTEAHPATGLAVVDWLPPSTADNCALFWVTSSASPGDPFPLGTTTVLYTATDSSGNFVTGGFLVTVTLEAPTALTYPVPGISCFVGSAIPPLSPSASGGPVVEYSITPPLPAGLQLDPTTGEISGTPLSATSATSHTVTATNAAGSATASLLIEVAPDPGVAPCNLIYPSSELVLAPDVPFSMSPTIGCGTPSSWSVTPALPDGLQLDSLSGVISGTPTTRGGQVVHTIRAENAGGFVESLLALRIEFLFEYVGSNSEAGYDPSTGALIPDGSTLPDPDATIGLPIRLREGENNHPSPGTFTPVVGFSIVLSFDGLELDVRAVEVGADLLGLNEGAGPDFWGPQILTDIVTVGVLFQLIPAPDGSWDQAITASDSLNPPEILVLRCAGAPGALDGNAGGLVTTIEFGDASGSTVVENEVVLDGSTGILPEGDPFTVTFSPAGP
ncbi:MAG: HYR domain-containing protein, partial [Planctomycetota bacterium]